MIWSLIGAMINGKAIGIGEWKKNWKNKRKNCCVVCAFQKLKRWMWLLGVDVCWHLLSH